ncbi:MAG: diguanylate cyclase [Syntrophaceae bacterium]|nr:diguanylate cyclase [Syntrophaceae bacterium]
MEKRQLETPFRLTVLSALLVAAVVLAGWMATDTLCSRAQQEIIREGEAAALTISVLLDSECERIEGAVRALSGSPLVVPALTGGKDADIEQANAALDRYNTSLNASVSYLMDREGRTVASSNRPDPDSFVGVSFQSRPYFQDAMRGLGGRYFGVGITSGKRGFFASQAVRDREGAIVGVAAMQKILDTTESFFSKYPHCYLVDPNGIVFLSSSPGRILKSLWPVRAESAAALGLSRQFGKRGFDAVLDDELTDGTEAVLDGETFIVSRRLFNKEGWSVVLLNSTKRIQVYRMAGILLTVAVLLLFTVVLSMVHVVSRSRQAIAFKEERFRELFGSMSSGVVVYEALADGMDFVIRDLNRSMERIGKVRKIEVVGLSVRDVFPGMRAMGLLDVFIQVWRTGKPKRMGALPYRDDRVSQWLENYVYKLPSGEIVAVCDDVSERKAAEEALQRSEEKYREILENMWESYVETDLRGNLTFFNPAACAMLKYSPEELRGLNYQRIMDMETVPEVAETFGKVFRTGVGLSLFECRLVRKDGVAVHVETSVNLRKDPTGKPVGFSGILRDISERKRFEEELQRQSVSDAMTGLFNRRGFVALAEKQMKIAQRNRMDIVLLFADMDGLKWINDNLGHRMGDEAIVEAASILKEAFRESDIIARVGGDEFVVLALGASLHHADAITGRFEECLRVHNAREGRDYKISISIGTVRCDPQESSSLDDLMTRADTLMYEQKKQRKAQRV